MQMMVCIYGGRISNLFFLIHWKIACNVGLKNLLDIGNISGLQMMKDGEWFTVEALSNAFVINIGNQLES
ncbi:hypothetical protein Leryth_016264 [Lithospermum erythrorhizon]|nr:hypothetical protein Leryth_016264 [Lithospermum erythrorhizon]